MIPKKYYFDDDILKQENDKIFKKTWQQVCFKSDLQFNNDYYTFLVGGIEGVIQNFDGELRAFSNYCPHRFSCLQTEKKGNRTLQCPYHRLQFNVNGIPTNKTIGDEYDYQQLKLQEWHIDTCGTLIFVCFDKPKTSLKEFLGNQFDYLEKLSSCLGEEIYYGEQLILANWKILIQNSMEFDHVPSVHPNTFSKLIQKPLKVIDQGANAPLIKYTTLFRQHTRDEKIIEKLYNRFCKTNYFADHPSYNYLLLYPLLTIGHSNGPVSFFKYTPSSADTTQLEIRTFAPKLLVQNSDYLALFNSNLPYINDFINRLAEEDKYICELIYRGLKSSPEINYLNSYASGDFLIEKFDTYYSKMLIE